MVLVFSHLGQLVEVFESLLVLLELQIKQTSFHQSLAGRLWVKLDDSGIRFDSLFNLAESFQAITLPQVAHTVTW